MRRLPAGSWPPFLTWPLPQVSWGLLGVCCFRTFGGFRGFEGLGSASSTTAYVRDR